MANSCDYPSFGFWRAKGPDRGQKDGIYCLSCRKRWRRNAVYVFGKRVTGLDEEMAGTPEEEP